MPRPARTTAAVWCAALLVASAGCSDDWQQPWTPIPPEATVPEEMVLSADTVLVEEDPRFVSVSASPGALVLTFNGDASDVGIAPGSVLVGDTGEGYLRRAVSLDANGSTLVVQTEPATIDDAMAAGRFEIEVDLRDPARSVWDLAGVQVLKAEDAGVDLRIASGSARFEPVLDVVFEKNTLGTPVALRAVASGSLTLDMDLVAEVAGSLDAEGEIPLLQYSQPFWFQAGPLPVAGVAYVRLHAGALVSAQASASVGFGFDASAEVMAGAEWERGEDWNLISGTSMDTSYDPPQWAFSGSLEAQVWLRPEIELVLYTAAGPSLDVQPYVLGTLDAGPPAEWELYAGVAGHVGFEVSVFSVQVVDWEADLFDERWLLDSGVIGAGDDDDTVDDDDTTPADDDDTTPADDDDTTPADDDDTTPTDDDDTTPTDDDDVTLPPDDDDTTPADDDDATSPPDDDDTTPADDDDATLPSDDDDAASPGSTWVSAGAFWMGCAPADSDCGIAESPYHQVTLDAFTIQITEVTVDAYSACVSAGACGAPGTGGFCNWNAPGREDHPINCVDWDQAEAFCAWAGGRLPTEAEWEKAARGTAGGIYPWGNAPADCSFAVMNDGSGAACGLGYGSGYVTWPVGSIPAGASPYGALDMAGNVSEWTADWLDVWYYSTSPATNPTGPASGTNRVFRGGGMGFDASSVRASGRAGAGPSASNFDRGFRCAGL